MITTATSFARHHGHTIRLDDFTKEEDHYTYALNPNNGVIAAFASDYINVIFGYITEADVKTLHKMLHGVKSDLTEVAGCQVRIDEDGLFIGCVKVTEEKLKRVAEAMRIDL